LAIYSAAWAIPLLPLLGALLSFGVETQRRAAQLCVVLSGLSFVVAAVLLGVRLTHAPASPFVGLLTFFSMLPPEGTIFATQLQAQVGVQIDEAMTAHERFSIKEAAARVIPLLKQVRIPAADVVVHSHPREPLCHLVERAVPSHSIRSMLRNSE